jgi:molecular chaperone HscC
VLADVADTNDIGKPRTSMTMIGIDLGTTNSLVAYWDGDKPQLIKNALNEYLTPSVVSIGDAGQIFVGDIAKQRLVSHPDKTVANFKRKMGSKAKLAIGKQNYSPEELSSLVLKQLKEDAETALGHTISSAVISVPAYFNDAQRKATKIAGELAGLKVERLINEPTAAAIAYGIHEKYQESNIIVIDLGGGTFDVSVLELFEGVMEVHASAGDNFLGGEDFTDALITHFLDKNQITGYQLSKVEQGKLTRKVNQLKLQLTTSEEALFQHNVQGKDYRWQCTRAEFDKICEKLVQKLRHPVERAIRDAKLQLDELDEVILVGGATRMPLVRNLVSRMFRRLPSSTINPDQVVALGTAVQSALINKNAALDDVVLTDVCPYTLGVEVSIESSGNQFEAGHFLPIIERNTTIPVSRMDTLNTIQDKQTQLRCNIYQGESRLVQNNVFLGALDVKVPKNKAGAESIDIRFTYNVNGILEVEVTVNSSKQTTKKVIKNSECNLSDKEIEESFERLSKIKTHPRDDSVNQFLLSKAERLYEESLGDKRQYVAQIIAEFDRVLNSQDSKLIEEKRVEFEKLLQDLEESIFE